MLILDTDHVVEFQKGTSPEALRLKERLERSGELYATTIISVEEMMRGWLSAIRRTTDPLRQIGAYARLRQLFRFFATWDVADWTVTSAAEFTSLKVKKTRVGAMDLRIASIVLSSNATLLTRNLKDFRKVPDLRCEDWLS